MRARPSFWQPGLKFLQGGPNRQQVGLSPPWPPLTLTTVSTAGDRAFPVAVSRLYGTVCRLTYIPQLQNADCFWNRPKTYLFS